MQSGDNPTGSNWLLQAGQTLDQRFEIVEEVGRGGMAVVYRSLDLRLQREVAIKVLNGDLAADPVQLERFRHEANVCSTLDHPNIVTVMHCGQEQGRPYMVMEWLDGKTLELVIEVEKKLSRGRFRQIFLPVLDALEYAHSKGLVHRDLKPANIMVGDHDGEIVVKVLDFGIAKRLDSAQALTAATVGFIGSPYFMSPEQLSGGKVSYSSDIYSLACVMFQALTGRLPFAGNSSLESMYEHLRLSMPKMKRSDISGDISAELIQCVLQALQKDPAKRPSSIVEFKSRIVAALNSKSKTFSLLPIVIGATVLLLLAGAAWIFLSKKTSGLSAPQLAKAELHHNLSGLSLQVALSEANRLSNEKKYGEAILRLEKALKNVRRKDDPHILELEGTLAGLCKLVGDYKSAKRYYSKLIDSNTFAASAVRLNAAEGLANTLMSEQNYAEAEKICAKYATEAESLTESTNIEYLANIFTVEASAVHLQHKNPILSIELCKKAFRFYGDSGRTLMSGVAITWFYYDRCCEIGKKDMGMIEVLRTQDDLIKYPPSGFTTLQFADEAERRGLLKIARKSYINLQDKKSDITAGVVKTWKSRSLAAVTRVDKEIAEKDAKKAKTK